MNKSLHALSLVAGDYQAKSVNLNHQDKAIYRLELNYADGSVNDFNIELTAKDAFVSVKELKPNHLPAFCPERHINVDGTFCLGFKSVDNLEVYDESSAREWWGRLLNFLKLQIRAARLRKWPGDAWAHGNAAKFQNNLKLLAQQLGQSFVSNLNQNKFRVERKIISGCNRAVLRLYCESSMVFAVWEVTKCVANTRQRCVCDLIRGKRRMRMRSCGNHAEICANFVLNKWAMQEAEREFWNNNVNKTCCGTMNGCHLAKN